jgi:signal transduction histidine kinase/CheY-like chemotaxis protein
MFFDVDAQLLIFSILFFVLGSLFQGIIRRYIKKPAQILKDDLHGETGNSFQFFTELSEQYPFDMIIKGPDDELLFASQGKTVAGLPERDLGISLGGRFSDILRNALIDGSIVIPNADLENAVQQFRDVEKTDGAEIEFQDRYGSWYRRTTRFLSSGRLLLIRVDITKDRQARDQLQRQRQQLDNILNSARSAICGLDIDGNIVFANAQALQYLELSEGFPARWPEQITMLSLLGADMLTARADPLHRARTGETIKGEKFILRRSTHTLTEYTRFTCAPIATPMPDGPVTILQLDDITVEENNRQQLERKGRLDALGQLTAGIAHDFNNVLGAIQYAMAIIVDETDTVQRNQVQEIAASSVARGSKLTNRLLTFAKQQPGQSSIIRLDNFIAEFERLVAATIEENITVKFMLDDPNQQILCDPSQLENALLNLVLNSRDAIVRAKKGNKIILRVSQNSVMDSSIQQSMILNQNMDDQEKVKKTFVSFSLSDNGPGMSEEIRNRATDPFFTTEEANAGKGLGLSIVYGFVMQAEGDLRISSEEGKGTTVLMTLPTNLIYEGLQAPSTPEFLVRGTGQTLLVVEDEDDLRMLTQRMLKSLGYQTLGASSGKQALELFQNDLQIDLVLTDIIMPGHLDGFQLSEKLKSIRPDIPIVYMSGYAQSGDDQPRTVQAPMLSKPIRPHDLAEALHCALKPIHQ